MDTGGAAKGSLEEVLINQKEAQAVSDQATEGAVPTLIKAMHDTYAKAKAKLEADRNKRSLPAFDAYSQALSLYIADSPKPVKLKQRSRWTTCCSR